MKLGPVTKLDDDLMSENCGVNVFYPIYGKFAAIRKPESGRMVYKTYICIDSNFLSYRK